MIAAEQTNRQAYLMEIDPLYCDVIVQRWEAFTGQSAAREEAPKIHPFIPLTQKEGGRAAG